MKRIRNYRSSSHLSRLILPFNASRATWLGRLNPDDPRQGEPLGHCREPVGRVPRRGLRSDLSPTRAVSLLLLAFAPALSAQPADSPVYEVGQVPDQRVWYNPDSAGLVFGVSAPGLGENPTISATWDVNRRPDGILEFDEERDRLTFVPAPTDTDPIEVNFLAVGSGPSVFQSVILEPMQPLPPEAQAFGIDPVPSSLPDPESRDFIEVQDVFNGDSIDFNEASEVETRNVQIIGKRIVWEAGHPNSLYENFHDQPNIRDLVMEAETVVIRAPLHFPQTNVTIHAANLVFEDPEDGEAASITTTPLIPEGGVRPPFGTAAKDGHNAGNLQVFAREIRQPGGSGIRFITRGGEGQDASPGKDGVDRATRPAIPRQIRDPVTGTVYNLGNDYVLFAWVERPSVLADIYRPDKANYEGSVSWGTSLLAPDGTSRGGNATPGSKPGDGGDGGNMATNLDLSGLLDQGGGGAGARAPTATGGRGATAEPSGGGSPRTVAYRVKITTNAFGEVTGSSTATFRSSFGSNATGPTADKPVGDPGSLSSPDPDSVAWLSPNALRFSLTYLNEAYLEGHIEVVSEQLEELLALFAEAESSPAWADLDGDRLADLTQIEDDLLTLRHRIGNNLDFFGNPAGWVPMLSFEVNKLSFDREIDRAMRVMYLNYWLGNIARGIEQRRDAMEEMRVELLAQVEADREAYEDAVLEIPLVENDAENLQVDIDETLRRIQVIEDELLPVAKSIVVLKKTARTLGKIAQTIPVYQPALGAAGGAVAASADIDPDKSWEENAILVGSGTAGGFANGKALSKAQGAQAATGQIDTNNPEGNDAAMEALQEARGPLLELLQDSYDSVTAEKGADPEVQAELERLLADVPEFNALKDELEELNVKKRDFAFRLSQLIQQITVLPIAISRNLRTVNQLNEEINVANDRLDPTTVSYLSDMDARATARLLKYHYYMARAYSYRRLEAYPGKLDLGSIQDRFESLATDPDDPAGAVLTAEQFDSLKAVYEEQVSRVAEAILEDANQNPPEQSISVELVLPDEIIAAINAGERPRINLKDYNLFPRSEENLRITDLTVKAMEATFDPDAPNPGTADLVIQHSGVSTLEKDGARFLFRHNNNETRSLIQWKTRYQFSNGSLTPSRPSAAASSLIGALVPEARNLLVYSRPAVNADLILSLDASATPGAEVNLVHATLEVNYDFTEKSQFFRTLEIAAGGSGFEPQIEIDTVDRNERSTGRGAFARSYNVGETVFLTAPELVGDMRFVRWSGSGITDPTNNQQEVTLSDNRSLQAIYEPATRYVLTVINGSGDGTYFPGERVTITADDPDPGKRFLDWAGGLPDDPTSPVTTLPVLSSDTIIAQYANLAEDEPVLLSLFPAGSGQVRLFLEAEEDGDWIIEESPDTETWGVFGTITVEQGSGQSFINAGSGNRFFRAVRP